jgi:hypothetical protein
MECHARTAAALGAVPLRHPGEVHRFGPAFIAVRGHDGSCWAWPLEKAFVAAIERR